jgi:hypothetical protein
MFIASTWYDHRVIPADGRSVLQEAMKGIGLSPNPYRVARPPETVPPTLA